MWSEDLGDYVDVDPAARVHVWVFALHTATERADYDLLDVTQWELRAVPHLLVWNRGYLQRRAA